MMEFFQGIDWSNVAVPIIEWALVALILYALPYIVPLAPKLFKAVQNQAQKIQNDFARGILLRLNEVVGQKVLAAENTAIEKLKDLAKSGKLSLSELPDELKQIKREVWEEIKRDLAAQGLWNLLLHIFGGKELNLEEYIVGPKGLIETHVSSLPPSGLQTPTISGQPPAFEVSVP